MRHLKEIVGKLLLKVLYKRFRLDYSIPLGKNAQLKNKDKEKTDEKPIHDSSADSDKTKIVRKLTLNEEEIDAELIVLEQRKENVKLKYEATKEGINALPPVEQNSEEEIRRKKILSKASIKLERRKIQLRKINELKKSINTQPTNDFLVSANLQRV
jgi:hypothetical protein